MDDTLTDDALADLPNTRTVDYAALERATGVRKDDPLSDIYFCGCMFYHMLSGHAPLFETKDPEEIVLSGPSANISFGGSSDKNLMVMGPGDDEKPEDATEARLLLKNTSLNEIGGLHIVRDSPGARVTLANAAGASIVLHADGHIELAPAPGKNVLVVGDLETEKITYRPGGGGGKKVLP
jgi:serine/threonine protein kinase